jgi:hypothetical protein
MLALRTGDLVVCTLVDCRFSVVGRGSGWINAGAARVSLGRAPGVLFRVCLWCMHAVVIKFCFAVGSRVCNIARASDIRCIIKMGASSLSGLSTTTSVDGFDSLCKAFDEATSFGHPCSYLCFHLQLLGECFEMCIGA